MRNAGLDEAQTGIKIARRNINNLRYTDDITLMRESEELKRPLMKEKSDSEKVGLKLNIQKTKIMASVPINSWQIDGEKMEKVTDLILGGSKITDFRKGRGTRDQIAKIRWIIEKAREFQKNIYFGFIDYAKAFHSVDHNKTVENSSRDGNTRPPDLPLEKPICKSGSNS